MILDNLIVFLAIESFACTASTYSVPFHASHSVGLKARLILGLFLLHPSSAVFPSLPMGRWRNSTNVSPSSLQYYPFLSFFFPFAILSFYPSFDSNVGVFSLLDVNKDETISQEDWLSFLLALQNQLQLLGFPHLSLSLLHSYLRG